jgi:hypothetical protein
VGRLELTRLQNVLTKPNAVKAKAFGMSGQGNDVVGANAIRGEAKFHEAVLFASGAHW